MSSSDASNRSPVGAAVDIDRANAARMYDYMLGGAQNFKVDRDRVDAVQAANPQAVPNAWANRAFLGRVVCWCTDRGIDQFLDLGSGVPTVGNVHEIALQALPAARVAYVDFEPVAVAHATELLRGLDAVTMTHADIRDPNAVLCAGGVAGLLDFTRPLALLAITVLHFVPGDIAALVDRYRQALAAGSVVAISHVSDDHDDPTVGEATRRGSAAYDQSATPIIMRDRATLAGLFTDLDLVDPGLVVVTDWPEPAPGPRLGIYGAVATIPPRDAHW